MTSEHSFFEEPEEHSIIKRDIVSKYFNAWSNVIISAVKKYNKKIAYIDLFSGQGQYKDGTDSTPTVVLKNAIQNSYMRENLKTFFFEHNATNFEALKSVINNLDGINLLKHSPEIHNLKVGKDILHLIDKTGSIPKLTFIDPYGYKGLSLSLINAVIKDWGSDCIFFFNYNRINPALSNPQSDGNMNELFGKNKAENLRAKINALSPNKREELVLNEICEALRDAKGKYPCYFRFPNKQGTRTSHYLVYVTKDPKGYEIMKGIMAKASSASTQGVPSFSYTSSEKELQMELGLDRPLDELQYMLLNDFAGKTFTMKEIFLKHSIGKNYTMSNYKEALKNLESANQITTAPPANIRRSPKGEITFADHVKVTFPKRS